jgi:benzoyl-CoA reductase/2-hydroxyglutaryl-CoA dehydratase subunit BcrC/BadD/HgdB
MAEMYGSPGYLLDRPYLYDERGLAYYTEEYEGLIEFLEEHTGHKMDYDRLKEAIARSYRVTELCLEINEFRKAVPEPFPTEGLFAQIAVLWLLAGTSEAVTFYEQMRDEVKERVDKGIGVIPKERFRLFFPFVLPFWDMSILDWMQEEHGAIITIDLINIWGSDPYWLKDPDKPVENLARKTFAHPACYQLHGPMEFFLESMVKSAEEYRVDGAVFFAHIGCRQACGCIRALKDELQDRLDLPVAVIDCDLVDKSFTSAEEVRGKLEEFFEMMEEKKGVGIRN